MKKDFPKKIQSSTKAKIVKINIEKDFKKMIKQNKKFLVELSK